MAQCTRTQDIRPQGPSAVVHSAQCIEDSKIPSLRSHPNRDSSKESQLKFITSHSVDLSTLLANPDRQVRRMQGTDVFSGERLIAFTIHHPESRIQDHGPWTNLAAVGTWPLGTWRVLGASWGRLDVLV